MNYLIKRASMLMMGSVLALACVDGTMAYESVPVTNGGTLQGKVSLKGNQSGFLSLCMRIILKCGNQKPT
jgi:hypothetical protein